MSIPTIDFFGHKLSRLIFGGNPVAGVSHTSPELDGAMMDYYTTENVISAVAQCLREGINTIQFRGDAHSFRLIREMRNLGMDFHWIAQSAPEMGSFEGGMARIAANRPTAIYMQGTDPLFYEGKPEAIRDRLKAMRDTGYPIGLGTHEPRLAALALEQDWDVDFFECCVYNMNLPDLSVKRFDRADCPMMYEIIRQSTKPCFAFKILAAARRAQTEADLNEAFEDAFANIKPCDAVVVGMMNRDGDQIGQNAQIVRRVLTA